MATYHVATWGAHPGEPVTAVEAGSLHDAAEAVLGFELARLTELGLHGDIAVAVGKTGGQYLIHAARDAAQPSHEMFWNQFSNQDVKRLNQEWHSLAQPDFL